MNDFLGRDDLAEQAERLQESMGGLAAVTAAFEQEVRRLQASVHDAGRDVGQLQRAIGSGLRRAIDGLVFDGDRLSDAFRNVGRAMIDAAYAAALRPVSDRVGGLLAAGVESVIGGVLPFARGGAFSQGQVLPFARGGIVTGPVSFALRGGRGLMGEAGPEAIMPLARGPDGRLGVRASGGGNPVTVVMNITTPDVEGFRRSRTQIAAELGRLLARGQRNR